MDHLRNRSRTDTGEVSLFILPEYSTAFIHFAYDAIHQLAKARDPVLDNFPVVTLPRRYRNRNTMPDGTTLDLEHMPVRTDFEISTTAIINCDGAALMDMFDRAVDTYLKSIMPQVFAILENVTAAAGTSIKAGGRALSAELIAEALEKMEVDFDDDGNPILPRVIVGEGANVPDVTTEGQRKIDEILRRKRELFLAQRRRRELPRHPIGNRIL